MEERINLNVSATNYEQTSGEISTILTMLEEMVHEEECFVISDSEFAFGWHFFVVSVNRVLVQKLSSQMGQDFEKLKGRGLDKKFLTWISQKIKQKNVKAKIAIKEEMESSKFGIFKTKRPSRGIELLSGDPQSPILTTVLRGPQAYCPFFG